MKYRLTESIQRRIMQELVGNDEFFKRWSGVLTPQHFKGESAERGKILQLILSEGKLHAPSFPMLEQMIQQESDRDTRKGLFDELEEIELCDKHLRRGELDDVAQQFVVNSKSLQAVEEQLKLIEEGRYAELGKPIERLIREGVGNSIVDDYFSLALNGGSDSLLSKRMATTWPSLNKYAFGGMGEEELWLVMGEMFKTHIMLHFCRAALLQSLGCFYATFEVKKTVLSARMTCLLTGCSLRDAVHEELWVLEALARQEKAFRAPFVLKEYPMHTITVDQLKSDVRLEEAKRNLKGDDTFKLVVVDYPDLMLAPKGSKTRFPTTDIYAALKRWAQEEGRRILVASQLTRTGQEQTTRGRNSVAEDKSKIDCSDATLSLNMTQEEYEQRLLRIFGVKFRVGTPHREVLLTWRPRSFKFVEID